MAPSLQRPRLTYAPNEAALRVVIADGAMGTMIQQRKLDEARKELAAQDAAHAGAERTAPYRDRIAQHERNLQALQKELANLR